MPYQRPENEDEEKLDGGQQTGGLLSGYMAPQQPAPAFGATMGRGPIPKTMGLGGSGPSVTGHVNFDRLYAANEATATRDATKAGLNAQNAAQKAQGGLSGLQGQFKSQSAGAVGRGPTSDDYARAGGGGMAFAQPPQMMAAQGKALGGAVDSRSQLATVAPDTEQNWMDTIQAQAGHKYSGPNSLAEMSGYKSVLADYGKAQDSVGALKSNEALQGSLERNKAGPHIEGGTKLDAALMGQAGRPEFARITEKHKGLGDELRGAVADSGRMGAEARAQAEANAAAHQGLLSGYLAGKPSGVAGDNGVTTASTSNPFGYKTRQEMMEDGGVGTDARDGIHAASQTLDPVSALQNELTEGNSISEEFRKGVGLDNDLNMQNMRSGFLQIEREFGTGAADWLFDNMSASDWDAIQGMNMKAVYRYFEQKLKSGDWYHQNMKENIEATGQTRGESQIVKQGGGGDADHGTTSDEEAARNQAYRDGWGTEYDEQFRSGNRKPVKP